MHFDTTILLKLQNQCHFFKRITEITVTKHIWKIQKYGYLIMIRARGQWSWMMVGSDLNLIKWYLQVWLLFQTWPFSGKKKNHMISDTWAFSFSSIITKNILTGSGDRVHSRFLILCYSFIDRDIYHFTIQGPSLCRMTLIYDAWTWVWANSKRWWRTGKSGVLQFLG